MFSYQVVVGFLVFVVGLLFLSVKLKRCFRLPQKAFFAWQNNQWALSSTAKAFEPLREKIFQCLHDMNENPIKVVEVGAGSGVNFKYLPENVAEVVCVEPNEFADKYLMTNLSKYPALNVKRCVGFAEDLSFIETESVDVVVCTHVLCTVFDAQQSLREVVRILKPGGKFLFMEHLKAIDRSWVLFMQNLLKHLWSFINEGCCLTRTTDVTIKEAGFREVEMEVADVIFPAWNNVYAIVSRHCSGFATK